MFKALGRLFCSFHFHSLDKNCKCKRCGESFHKYRLYFYQEPSRTINIGGRIITLKPPDLIFDGETRQAWKCSRCEEIFSESYHSSTLHKPPPYKYARFTDLPEFIIFSAFDLMCTLVKSLKSKIAQKMRRRIITEDEKVNRLTQIAQASNLDAFVNALFTYNVDTTRIKDVTVRRSLSDALKFFPSQRDICTTLLKNMKIKTYMAIEDVKGDVYIPLLWFWRPPRIIGSIFRLFRCVEFSDSVRSTKEIVDLLVDNDGKPTVGISLYKLLGGRESPREQHGKLPEGKGDISRDGISYTEFGYQWERIERIGRDRYGLIVAYLDD